MSGCKACLRLPAVGRADRHLFRTWMGLWTVLRFQYTPRASQAPGDGRGCLGFGRLDLIIVVAFLAGVTLLGAYFRRHQHDINDYFLGRRTTPWWAISLSIVATETSTLTLIGIPALAYGSNLAFLQLALGYIVARFLIKFSCCCRSISAGSF